MKSNKNWNSNHNHQKSILFKYHFVYNDNSRWKSLEKTEWKIDNIYHVQIISSFFIIKKYLQKLFFSAIDFV